MMHVAVQDAMPCGWAGLSRVLGDAAASRMRHCAGLDFFETSWCVQNVRGLVRQQRQAAQVVLCEVRKARLAAGHSTLACAQHKGCWGQVSPPCYVGHALACKWRHAWHW